MQLSYSEPAFKTQEIPFESLEELNLEIISVKKNFHIFLPFIIIIFITFNQGIYFLYLKEPCFCGT